MERNVKRIYTRLSFSFLEIEEKFIGNDILLSVYGGSEPHIGGTVLSVPRESLSGDGTYSCTSNVINVTGHKDEMILRMLAESAASIHNKVCVCTGGFHYDDISTEQINEIIAKIEEIKEIL